MPLRKIPPKIIFKNIVQDFEAAWNAISTSKTSEIGRGNFLFGLLGTVLLEWACRVCHQDRSDKLLHGLTTALYQIEPRYFTPLPPHTKVVLPKQFKLPSIAGANSPPLLWALFDLIRNGQAHQYQQIPALLKDDCYLWISIKGAEPGRTLSTAAAERAPDHLAFCQYRDGNVGVRVRTELFFQDIRAAIQRSGLLDTEVAHDYLTRSYGISPSKLLGSLQEGKHSEFAE
jgi:hypothetical protein